VLGEGEKDFLKDHQKSVLGSFSFIGGGINFGLWELISRVCGFHGGLIDFSTSFRWEKTIFLAEFSKSVGAQVPTAAMVPPPMFSFFSSQY
jgi:hypothetical protein